MGSLPLAPPGKPGPTQNGDQLTFSPSSSPGAYLTCSRALSNWAERWGRTPSQHAQPGRISLHAKSVMGPDNETTISARLPTPFYILHLIWLSQYSVAPVFALVWKKRRNLLLTVRVKLDVLIVWSNSCALQSSAWQSEHVEKDGWLQSPFLNRNVNIRGSLGPGLQLFDTFREIFKSRNKDRGSPWSAVQVNQ